MGFVLFEEANAFGVRGVVGSKGICKGKYGTEQLVGADQGRWEGRGAFGGKVVWSSRECICSGVLRTWAVFDNVVEACELF